LALLFAATLWGGNYAAGHVLSRSMGPAAISFWRWAIATGLLAPFATRATRASLRNVFHHWKPLTVLSLSGVVGFSVCLYSAVVSTTTLNAALTLSTCPILIPIISAIAFREGIHRRQLAAISLSTSAVILLITHGDLAAFTTLQFGVGDCWAVAAAISFSLYSALLRLRPRDLAPLSFLQVTAFLGALVLLPIGAGQGLYSGMSLDLRSAAALTYLGVGVSLVGFWAWNYGVARIGSTQAGVYMHAVPLSAAIIAVVFEGEHPLWFHFAAVALIVPALCLATPQSQTSSLTTNFATRN
jgi:drug/metabolite transporter (DMT)-like permease